MMTKKQLLALLESIDDDGNISIRLRRNDRHENNLLFIQDATVRGNGALLEAHAGNVIMQGTLADKESANEFGYIQSSEVFYP